MRGLRHTWALARREAAAYLRSPIAYVVLVLFLVVQGFSFFAVLKVLADPRHPSPYGAVLRTHFGGTFLYWAFLFFTVASIAMRLIAEEKGRGTWEGLRTAPVSEAAIAVGKWLGALTFYAFLWAPTVAYVLILRAFAPIGAAPDVGPIASAYLGVLLTGGAFLAIGLCASALTSNQIIASVIAFVALTVLLLAGLAPEISPEIFARHASLAQIVGALDVRHHMDDFARGIIDTRHVSFYVTLTVAALATATVIIGGDRRPRAQRGSAWVFVALVIAAALLVNVIAARHPKRLDVTHARVYSLDAKTQQIIHDVHRPVRVLVLSAGVKEFAPLYDEIRELLRRFTTESALISVEELDPSLDPGRVQELAQEYALRPEEISGGGAVIFLSGERHRAVALLDMAEFGGGTGGAELRSFRGEDQFAAALLDVSDDERPELCFTSGHGELPLAADPDGRAELSMVATLLEHDGERVGDLASLETIPARCAVVAIFGAVRSFTPSEAHTLEDWLGKGGRLLVALDPELDATGDALLPSGLEGVLERYGIRLRHGIVVDPEHEIGVPLVWETLDGYGDHPISAAFRGRRATVWYEPRWIEPLAVPGVTAHLLVSSSPAGWTVTDLSTLRGRAPAAPGAHDVRGPVSIAVASEKAAIGARVVVIGSARSFTSAAAASGYVDDALVGSAMAWLTGRTKLVGVGAKTPEQFRVVLTAQQETRMFFLCVVGLPLLAAAAGVLAWWRRRRVG